MAVLWATVAIAFVVGTLGVVGYTLYLLGGGGHRHQH